MNRGELLKEYAQAKEAHTQLTKELDGALKRLAKARNDLMDSVCLQVTLRKKGVFVPREVVQVCTRCIREIPVGSNRLYTTRGDFRHTKTTTYNTVSRIREGGDDWLINMGRGIMFPYIGSKFY